MLIKVTEEYMIARSISFFWWKRIYVGRYFKYLSKDVRMAVLAHEEGHCNLHHTELRVISLLFVPFLISYICKQHELAADRYAASKGHAKALIKLLSVDNIAGHFHPSNKVRREQLEKYECLRTAPVKGYSQGSA